MYLDSTEVNNYLSMVEDGLLVERTETQNESKELNAKAGVSAVGAGGSKASNTEISRKTQDTAEARFKRLIAALRENPEDTGFVEVFDPESDFSDIETGAIVLWEVDVDIPPFLRMVASGGEGAALIELMQEFAPSAQKAGVEIQGIPDLEVLDGYVGMMRSMNLNSLCVGDDDDTDWAIAGAMHPDGIRELPDDSRALMLGKVKKRIKRGSHHHMMAVPGMGLARKKRRSLDKTPQPGKEDQFLEGPLLMLDLIAVFR